MDPLLALVIAVQAAIAPGADKLRDAREIATAIAYAVANEPAPVLASAEEDAAALVVWSWRESSFTRHAVGDRGMASPALGAWQIHAGPLIAFDLKAAAAYELKLAREGARVCPEQPFAPLSGGCRAARRLADRRVAWARKLLDLVRGVSEAQP